MTDVANPEVVAEAGTADAVEVEQTTADTPAADGVTKRKSMPIQVTVPVALFDIIKEKAKEADKSQARWVLENIAGDLGFDLEPATARGAPRQKALFPKTLTPEAKRERHDAAVALLAALDAGEIDLAAIKAKLGLS